MLTVRRVIRPTLQRAYVARNGGTGTFYDFILTQSAVGAHKVEAERSWLVVKGATASGKNLSELWDTYLTSKGYTAATYGPLKDRMKAFFLTGTQS
jgi:hypothetical protein